MAEQPTSAAASRRPNRRRFLQFSMWGLLLAVTAISVWLGTLTNAANRQRRAVEFLIEHGASVSFDYQRLPPDTDGIVNYSSGLKPPGPEWLRALIGEDYFRTAASVSFSGRTRITEEISRRIGELNGLEHLGVGWCPIDETATRHFSRLHRLRSLLAQDSKFTDADMEHLAASNLEIVSLSGNQVTGEGLAYLKGAKNLRNLFLYDNPIGDDGIAHIAGLTNLELLGLARTRITDQSLPHLESLKNLKYVSLVELKLSKEALQRLARALPNCKIEYFP